MLVLIRIASNPDARVESRRERNLLRHLRNEAGQSAVEFALVLPILLLVVTGITTFGIAMNNFLMLTHATDMGARQLAISRGQTTDPCATTVTAIKAAAPLLNPNSLSYTFILNGTTYTGTTCSSGSTTTGAAGNLLQGVAAQVNVTYPCTLKAFGTTIASSCTLRAQTAEYVQ